MLKCSKSNQNTTRKASPLDSCANKLQQTIIHHWRVCSPPTCASHRVQNMSQDLAFLHTRKEIKLLSDINATSLLHCRSISDKTTALHCRFNCKSALIIAPSTLILPDYSGASAESSRLMVAAESATSGSYQMTNWILRSWYMVWHLGAFKPILL